MSWNTFWADLVGITFIILIGGFYLAFLTCCLFIGILAALRCFGLV